MKRLGARLPHGAVVIHPEGAPMLRQVLQRALSSPEVTGELGLADRHALAGLMVDLAEVPPTVPIGVPVVDVDDVPAGWCTTSDGAAALGLADGSSLRRQCARGRLPAMKVRGVWFFDLAAYQRKPRRRTR